MFTSRFGCMLIQQPSNCNPNSATKAGRFCFVPGNADDERIEGKGVSARINPASQGGHTEFVKGLSDQPFKYIQPGAISWRRYALAQQEISAEPRRRLCAYMVRNLCRRSSYLRAQRPRSSAASPAWIAYQSGSAHPTAPVDNNRQPDCGLPSGAHRLSSRPREASRFFARRP